MVCVKKGMATSIAKRSTGDAMLAQETNICRHDCMRAAEGDARREGWNPVLTAMQPTSATMGSGGQLLHGRAPELALCEMPGSRKPPNIGTHWRGWTPWRKWRR